MIFCGADIAKDGIHRQAKALKIKFVARGFSCDEQTYLNQLGLSAPEALDHASHWRNSNEEMLSRPHKNAGASILDDWMAFRSRANGTKMEIARP